MAGDKLSVGLRQPNPFVQVIDIRGAITSFTEKTLVDAYQQAVSTHIRAVIINFTELSYLNSLGIGLLVTLLIRARREGVALVSYGLNEHYRQVFQITRLDQAIPIYSSEATAISYVAPMDLPEREA
jgi:anti-sigma B factor antagonist